MLIKLFLLIFFVLAIVFYKLSGTNSNKIFLVLHFVTFMGFAALLYPLLVKQADMYVLTMFPFFLPMISTLRLYEINNQKTKEQKMREIH